jgi:hypothetical protein
VLKASLMAQKMGAQSESWLECSWVARSDLQLATVCTQLDV